MTPEQLRTARELAGKLSQLAHVAKESDLTIEGYSVGDQIGGIARKLDNLADGRYWCSICGLRHHESECARQ